MTFMNEDALRDMLKTLISDAVSAGDWERMDRLVEALNLLKSTPKDEMGEAIDLIYELLPELSRQGADIAAIESSPVGGDNPTPEGSDTSDATSTDSEQDEDGYLADPVLSSEDGEDQHTGLFAEQQEDTLSSGEAKDTPAGEGWRQLRDLVAHPPERWNDLAAYIDRYSRILDQLGDEINRYLEGRQATENLELLKRIQNTLNRMEELSEEGQRRIEEQNVDLLGRVLRDLRELAQQIESEEDLERKYYSLYNDILHTLRIKIRNFDEQRQKVAAQLRTFLTLQKLATFNEQIKLLQDFETKRENRVEWVPIDDTDETYNGLDTAKKDGIPMARLDDVERRIREQLVKIAHDEARRLMRQAEDAIKESKLQIAAERLKKARDYAFVEELSGASELAEIREEIINLEERLAQQRAYREQAEKKIGEARREKDPERALRLLQESAMLFPDHPLLETTRNTRAGELLVRLKREIESLQRRCERLLRQRQYNEAERLVQDKLKQLSSLEPLLPKEKKSEIERWIDDLQGLEERILKESEAWDNFQKTTQRIRQKDIPTTEEGILDEGALRKEFDIEDALFERFAKEWESLKSELSVRVGAKAQYHQVQELFKKDPADERILGLLQHIDDPAYDHEIRVLERKHRAYVALRRAKEELEQGDAFGTAWRDKLIQSVAEVRKWAGELDESEEKAFLLDEANRIEDAVSLYQELLVLSRQEQDPTAILEHLRRIDVGDNPLKQQIIKHFRLYIKKKWQNELRAFLKERIFEGQELNSDYNSIRQDVRLEDINNALEEFGRLNKYGWLDFEHAGLLQHRLERLRHELRLRDVLLAPGQSVTEIWTSNLPGLMKTIELRAERGMTPEQWEVLLSSLKALRHSSPIETGIASKTAAELWFYSLVFYARLGKEEEVIKHLQEERNEEHWLATHPLLCALLALRVMRLAPGNNDSGEQKRVFSELMTSLESYGLAQEPLRRTLQKLSDARDLWRRHEYEQAEKLLGEFIEEVTRLLEPYGLGEPYVIALKQTKTWLLDQWRRVTCNEMRQQIITDTHLKDPFEMLDKITSILKMCGSDPQLEERKFKLEEIVSNECERLEREVEIFLSGKKRDLPRLIQEGEKLLRKMEASLQVTGRSSSRLSSYGSSGSCDLETKKEDLERNVGAWKRALRVIEDVQRGLLDLFAQDDWFWNSNREDLPLFELERFSRELDEVQKELSPSVDDVDQLTELIDVLIQHTLDLGSEFEAIKTRYEARDFQDKEDFDDLLNNIRQFRKHIKEFDRAVREKVRQMNMRLRLQILEGHVHVDDDDLLLLREAPGARNGKIRTITSLRDLQEAVERLKRNWRAWDDWGQRTVELLAAIRKEENAVKRSLENRKGQLGKLAKAKLALEDIKSLVYDLQRQKKRIPEPPYTEAALGGAKAIIDDYTPDPELEEMWEKVVESEIETVQTAWKEFLETEFARLQERMKSWHDVVEERQRRLQELLEKMRHHVTRVDSKKATKTTQRNFLRWLEEAEEIDAEDEQVKRYRQEYERRERTIENNSKKKRWFWR